MFLDHLARVADMVETYLSDVLDESATPERLRLAMRHAVLGAGKRLRPFLVIESAAMFKVPAEDALATAAALECIHCYSLVHDDLPAMDNDTVRRGQPTVWAAFDDWTAILAGDALLTLAFELASRPDAGPADSVRATLCSMLARAAGRAGMVGGQCLDLDAGKRNQPAAPDRDHIARLQAMKTGALIRYACEAGAVLARASEDHHDALRTFGEHLGLAFQIADDLLDTEGEADTVGKATGKDAAAGKATLVGLLGPETARAELRKAHQAAIAALAPFGAEADTLRAAADFVVSRDR
jgi:farnesyl diphosphate synthase